MKESIPLPSLEVFSRPRRSGARQQMQGSISPHREPRTKSPLNAPLGFSELRADERYDTLNGRQRRHVGALHAGGSHLLTLIADILDLSKIEAGKMEVVHEQVSVSSAFAKVLSWQPLADKKSQA
jgi:signal transduction histidine kinase